MPSWTRISLPREVTVGNEAGHRLTDDPVRRIRVRVVRYIDPFLAHLHSGRLGAHVEGAVRGHRTRHHAGDGIVQLHAVNRDRRFRHHR